MATDADMWRRLMNRPDVEREAFHSAWCTLENRQEKSVVEAEESWEKMAKLVGAPSASPLPSPSPSPSPSPVPQPAGRPATAPKKKLAQYLAEVTGSSAITPPSSYTGPKVPQTITQDTAKELADAFRTNVRLHSIYVRRVLILAWHHLKTQCQNVMKTTIPKPSGDGRLIVVGDLHGQLTDLLTIFGKYGWPSDVNRFVFNGDYVDRGPQSIEVLLVLYCLRIACPTSIYLNRGNHEERFICEGYDFREQVLERYNELEFDLACKTFKYLPLVTVVNDVIFITHGGIPVSKGLTIADISRYKRMNPHEREGDEAHLVKCFLWGDPQELDGWAESHRGAGYLFGPDITAEFLKVNKFQLFIRSHEMKPEGFEWAHKYKLITVFSASNYCGSSDNKGAVIVFDSKLWGHASPAAWPQVIPKTDSYYAAAFAGTGEACKNQTLEMLRKEMFMKRHHLVTEFAACASEQHGTVSIEDFILVLGKIVAPGLRWDVLWLYFTKDEDGCVDYLQFLANYKIVPKGTFWMEWARDTAARLCTKMQETQSELKKAFRDFDVDGSGSVSYKEFTQALTKFDLALSDEQIYDLFVSIDTDQNGQISFQEFATYFDIIFTKQKAARQTSSMPKGKQSTDFIGTMIIDISRVLKAHEMQLKRLFRKMDVDMTGTVSISEFRVGMNIISKLLPKPLTDEQIAALFQIIDKDKSGTISLEELLEGFSTQ